MLTHPYTKPLQWAHEYLSSHGYTLLKNPPEDIQKTPWSYLVRFATTDGYIYMKQTPPLLALEFQVTQILHDRFHAAVPDLIANQSELNCFLMKDAGISLRTLLKKQFDITLLYKAADQFTKLQLTIADHVNVFLDIGVPDWRLNKLADLYLHLISQTDLLIADGLSEIEADKLMMQLPKITELCIKLSDYAIQETIVQPDFHDNNILVDDTLQNLTFIDLGEIVISHPFFSLVNFIRQIQKHHDLKNHDERYEKLIDACLKNYMADESQENVLAAFKIAHELWPFYEALAHYRLRIACDEANLMPFQNQGRLANLLKNGLSLP